MAIIRIMPVVTRSSQLFPSRAVSFFYNKRKYCGIFYSLNYLQQDLFYLFLIESNLFYCCSLNHQKIFCAPPPPRLLSIISLSKKLI